MPRLHERGLGLCWRPSWRTRPAKRRAANRKGDQMTECTMCFRYATYVVIDQHAKSVTIRALDLATGETRGTRLSNDPVRRPPTAVRRGRRAPMAKNHRNRKGEGPYPPRPSEKHLVPKPPLPAAPGRDAKVAASFFRFRWFSAINGPSSCQAKVGRNSCSAASSRDSPDRLEARRARAHVNPGLAVRDGLPCWVAADAGKRIARPSLRSFQRLRFRTEGFGLVFGG